MARLSPIAEPSEGVPARAALQVQLDKGDVIFRQGDRADHWYEVVSGVVRTCRFLADGHRQITGFFYNGDVFGAEARRYQVMAEALTPVVLLRCAHSEGPPQSAALSRALTSAQDYIALFAHRTASERLAAFLMAIARKPRGAQQIELPMSRSDIADHLGLTIHTVSRTMSDFARRQIISVEDRTHICVLDHERLSCEAGEL